MVYPRALRSRWVTVGMSIAIMLALTGPLAAPAQAAASEPKGTPTEAVCAAPQKPGEMSCRSDSRPARQVSNGSNLRLKMHVLGERLF